MIRIRRVLGKITLSSMGQILCYLRGHKNLYNSREYLLGHSATSKLRHCSHASSLSIMVSSKRNERIVKLEYIKQMKIRTRILKSHYYKHKKSQTNSHEPISVSQRLLVIILLQATLSLINMAFVFPTLHLGLLADILGISLKACRHM